MEISIKSVKQWGEVVAAVRKSQDLDQTTAGEFAGSSINTVGQFEKGSGKISLNRVFALMEALGIEIKLDIALPESDTKARKKLKNTINLIGKARD